MKKRILLIIIIILILLIIIEVTPLFIKKTFKMTKFETENFIFYYEKEDYQAVQQLKEKLETQDDNINSFLDFEPKEKTIIYVYPNQKSLQIRKYGSIVLLFNLPWYIGDNINEKIIIISPNNPGTVHSSETVINAVTHEYTHTVIDRINSKTKLWIDEGIALYLTNGKPFLSVQNYYHIPTFEETQTKSPIKFEKVGGYQFAHVYIEYLVNQYGIEKLNELVRNPENFESIYGKTEKVMYNEWIDYLYKTYP